MNCRTGAGFELDLLTICRIIDFRFGEGLMPGNFWVEYLKYFCIHLFWVFRPMVVHHPPVNHLARSQDISGLGLSDVRRPQEKRRMEADHQPEVVEQDVT